MDITHNMARETPIFRSIDLAKALKIAAITLLAVGIISVLGVALFYGHIPLLIVLSGLVVWKSALIMGTVSAGILLISSIALRIILKKKIQNNPGIAAPLSIAAPLTKQRVKEQLARDLFSGLNAHLWLDGREVNLTLETEAVSQETYATRRTESQQKVDDLYEEIRKHFTTYATGADLSEEEIERRVIIILSHLCQGATEELAQEMLEPMQEQYDLEHIGQENLRNKIELRLNGADDVTFICRRIDRFKNPETREEISLQHGEMGLSQLFAERVKLDRLTINGMIPGDPNTGYDSSTWDF